MTLFSFFRFGRSFPFLALSGGLALAACQWAMYVFAPVAADTGVIQKIFYIHLPLAWWGMISFFVVFVSSLVYLRTKSSFWDALAGAAAEVGVLLAGLALVTGSLWAKRSWGVWWTWDPRLTTTLIMWFIYAGYLILRGLDLPEDRRNRIAAAVGVIAFLDVPLVFISARLWRSIHPAVFAAKEGGLDPDMKITVIVCVVAFGFFWAALVGVRCRLACDEHRISALAAEKMLRE